MQQTLDVFQFRDELIRGYRDFSTSFTTVKASDIRLVIDTEYGQLDDETSSPIGRYWGEPRIQVNPNYLTRASIEQLVAEQILHPLCTQIFRKDGNMLNLYEHQVNAISQAKEDRSYVVTTGTGSGKSLAFFIPIIDHIIREKEKNPSPRTRAIIVYPMNALANSQMKELASYLGGGEEGQRSPDTRLPTFKRYTGQESESERDAIANHPPDILLTNYMMLEYLMTRHGANDKKVMDNCHGLEFLVLDELHTYRGRQGADVALLVRRLRTRTEATNLICIGTMLMGERTTL